ncbi:MAG: discoidin domain-containing protein, partial [Sedimentisphaerales bacterium]|nr:discoidin domain-containing protein [Sedimentisphaerales bacterium]
MEIRQPFLSRKDYAIVGILTAICSAIALVNLGCFKSPQSYWKPANKGESFYIDAGASQNIDRVSFFLSFGAGSYLIDFSDDGQIWRDEKRIEQKNIYEPLEWRYFNLGSNARYVRITAEKPGAMLNEIGLFATGTATPIPVKAISAINVSSISPECGKPENVFDEPATVAYVPSFINGMYFD